jgi:gluconokinase
MNSTNFFIIMGVSGCGKTSVGKLLAARLGWDFYDADDFHPPENIAKMAAGHPLNDEDRAPWLVALREMISSNLAQKRSGVLACSALKERYRQTLLAGNQGTQIIYLKGSFEVIQTRLAARAGHYMKPELLQSQFDALEEPAHALTVDIMLPIDIVVDVIASAK